MLKKQIVVLSTLVVVIGLYAMFATLLDLSRPKPASPHDYSNTWEMKWVYNSTEYAENTEIPASGHETDLPFEVKIYKDGANVTNNFYFAHSMLGYITTQTGHYVKVKVEDAGRGEKGIVWLAQQSPSATEIVRISTYAYYAAEDRFVNGSVYFKHTH